MKSGTSHHDEAESAASRRIPPYTKAPNPERETKEHETERGRDRQKPGRDTRAVNPTQHRCDRKVRDTRQRHDVREKGPEPARVDVERVLARLHTAVRQRVRDLETLHRPAR